MNEHRSRPMEEVHEKFGRKLREKAKQGEARGRNVNLEFSFTRHGKPEKDPATGMSRDVIIPEGLEAVRQKGRREEQERYIMVTGSSSVKRARQTGQSWRQGVTETGMADIINREGHREGGSKEFGVYLTKDLNIGEGSGEVLKPIVARKKEEGKQLVSTGKLKSEELQGWVEGAAMAEYLDLPEEHLRNFKWKDKAGNERTGVVGPHDIARNIAHRLWTGIRMSDRLFEGMDTKINNFTHGTNPESLLKYVIKLEDKDGKEKTGFDKVEEIGGTLTPGESIDFDIKRDARGELKPITIKLRGKKYGIDMEALKKLVEEYAQNKGKIKK